MKALVTGATGFIGSNLAAALVARGDQVRVLRRPTSRLEALSDLSVETVIGDVLNPASLAAAMRGCQTVFHAAGAVHFNRGSKNTTYRVNIEGTCNVMQAALDSRVARVVHTSSIAALGYSSPSGTLADESQVFPQWLDWWSYGHSKYLAELETQKVVKRGLPAVIVNPGIVLGPRDVNLTSGSIVRASRNGQLRVVPPGGANVVHVGDVVAGHLSAAERGRIGERYILGGENLSYWQIASTIAEVTEGAPPLLALSRWLLGPIALLVDAFQTLSHWPQIVTGELLRLGGETFYVDKSKALRELGLPQTPFRQAVVDAYNWYREHKLL